LERKDFGEWVLKTAERKGFWNTHFAGKGYLREEGGRGGGAKGETMSRGVPMLRKDAVQLERAAGLKWGDSGDLRENRGRGAQGGRSEVQRTTPEMRRWGVAGRRDKGKVALELERKSPALGSRPLIIP